MRCRDYDTHPGYGYHAPKAIGPYNQAVIDNNSGLIFTAMQIALDPNSGEMSGDDIDSQTHQVFNNLKNILEAAGSGFEKAFEPDLFQIMMKWITTSSPYHGPKSLAWAVINRGKSKQCFSINRASWSFVVTYTQKWQPIY